MKSSLAAVAVLVASVAAQTGDECVDQCVVKYTACCQTQDEKDPNCLFFANCHVTTLTDQLELFCQIGNLASCGAFCGDGRLVITDGTLACGSNA